MTADVTAIVNDFIPVDESKECQASLMLQKYVFKGHRFGNGVTLLNMARMVDHFDSADGGSCSSGFLLPKASCRANCLAR